MNSEALFVVIAESCCKLKKKIDQPECEKGKKYWVHTIFLKRKEQGHHCNLFQELKMYGKYVYQNCSLN